MLRRHSWRAGSGREAHLEGRKIVRRLSQRTGSGWEAIPEGREWLESLPGGPGVVGRPSQRVGSG